MRRLNPPDNAAETDAAGAASVAITWMHGMEANLP